MRARRTSGGRLTRRAIAGRGCAHSSAPRHSNTITPASATTRRPRFPNWRRCTRRILMRPSSSPAPPMSGLWVTKQHRAASAPSSTPAACAELDTGSTQATATRHRRSARRVRLSAEAFKLHSSTTAPRCWREVWTRFAWAGCRSVIRATLGGNVANGSPIGDGPCPRADRTGRDRSRCARASQERASMPRSRTCTSSYTARQDDGARVSSSRRSTFLAQRTAPTTWSHIVQTVEAASTAIFPPWSACAFRLDRAQKGHHRRSTFASRCGGVAATPSACHKMCAAVMTGVPFALATRRSRRGRTGSARRSRLLAFERHALESSAYRRDDAEATCCQRLWHIETTRYRKSPRGCWKYVP